MPLKPVAPFAPHPRHERLHTLVYRYNNLQNVWTASPHEVCDYYDTLVYFAPTLAKQDFFLVQWLVRVTGQPLTASDIKTLCEAEIVARQVDALKRSDPPATPASGVGRPKRGT